MKEKIEQLAKGNFIYELPTLLLSDTSITICMETGAVYRGKFTISNDKGTRMKGILYSKDEKLRLLTDKFIGKKNEIIFEYSTEGMKEEKEITSEISLVTDCGEKSLPLFIKVTKKPMESSVGKISNLSEFVYLSRINWEEAVSLFQSEQFQNMIAADSAQMAFLYRNLIKGNNMSHAMDEFLCAIHKKKPVTIAAEKMELTYEANGCDEMDEVVIFCENYGYINITVVTDASFLSVQKKVISEEDFVHNRYKLPVLLKMKDLKEGNHTGTILLKTSTQTVKIRVNIKQESVINTERRKEKKIIVKLLRNYIDFFFDKKTQEVYKEEEQKLLKEYRSYNEEAAATAEDAGVSNFSPDMQDGPETDYEKQYEDMQQMFKDGVRSPIFYCKAYEVIAANPSVMHYLGAFEQNVILFALRNKGITEKLKAAVIYLAQKEKNYSFVLHRILWNLYERDQDKEAIQCLCSLLIRSNQRAERYHFYYELGVSLQLRVAQLPEYYIYSMKEREYQNIHPLVISYFNFNNHLPEAKRAFYYACLLSTQKKEDVLVLHRAEIEQFVIKQLENGNFSTHLAVLCNQIVPGMTLDEKIVRLLSNHLFKYQIICENSTIKAVCVVHKELKDEVIVPLIRKSAFIDLVTDDAEIYLIGEHGFRYKTGIPYQLKKLVALEKYYTQMFLLYPDSELLNLYLSFQAQQKANTDVIAIEEREKLLESRKLSQTAKNEIVKTLIYYYYENCEIVKLKQCLEEFDVEEITTETDKKVIEIMMDYGFEKKVLTFIEKSGVKGLDEKKIYEFCRSYLKKPGRLQEKEPIVVKICSYIMGKEFYNSNTLTYLTMYFNGTTKEMYELLKNAREKNVDTESLEERLLGQILFAGTDLKEAASVFMNYYRSGSNHKLIQAFLGACAYQFLLFDQPSIPEIFDVMRQEIKTEEKGILSLAYLKYLSGQEHLTEADKNFSMAWITYYDRIGCILPFFKDFTGKIPLPSHITDHIQVEYRCDLSHKVMIHYQFLNGQSKDDRTEEMKNLCFGIHVHEFTIFHNEVLQYYITEETKEGIKETVPKRITSLQKKEDGNRTNLGRINAIIDADEGRDEENLQMLLKAYSKLDYSVLTLIKDINDSE